MLSKKPLHNSASLEETGHFDEISHSSKPAYAGRPIGGEQESEDRKMAAFNENAELSSGFSKLLIVLVRLYQWCIRPVLGNCCRFYPSCSEYAIEALKKHGSFKGVFLTVKRMGKCHPWHRGGVDLVP